MTAALSKLQLNLTNGSTRDFFHRGTHADVGVLQQQFANNDYALDRLRRAADILAGYQSIV